MKVLICGAGIMGLTIANECLSQGHYVTIIEKESMIGAHASGRNSGVLHSGIYYPKDTLKAQLCSQGKPLFRQFCSDHHIPIDTCGKVLVTKSKKELKALSMLYKRGIENGIDIEKLSEKTLSKKEPFAKTVDTALWVSETAVFDPKIVLMALIKNIQSNKNGHVLFDTEFEEIVDMNCVLTSKGLMAFDIFINAAGGYADKIAHQFSVAKQLTLIPFKGIYKKLPQSIAKHIKCHIYPVPDLENPFLGVHFTKSITGDVYSGPTAIPVFSAENYHLFEKLGWDSVKILVKDATLFLMNKKFRRVALSEPKRYIHRYFYQEAKQLAQVLSPDQLLPCDKVGIRPQLVDWNTKELLMDFHIEKKDNHIHVLNAISPAFTCCFAFAKHVLKNYLL